jgi:hypothetical protein
MGRLALADRARESSQQLALRAHIADKRHALAAWYIRDAVTSLTIRASQKKHRLTRADRQLFAAAQTSALEGSMALLIRQPLVDCQAAVTSTAGSRSVKMLPPPARGA